MMNLSDFFNSYPGMYLAQSFVHSLIAALLVDTSLIAWKIEDPAVRQRFRLLVIIVPIVSFPLYQFIAPERGSASFRLEAIFDINRWLSLELWESVPMGILFLLFLGFAAVVFIFQEMVPIVRHTVASKRTDGEFERPGPGSPVALALAGIPGEKPDVFVIDDDELVMFSSTGKKPAVFLSNGLLRALTIGELRAALAHEMGHIARSRRPLMVFVFLLRMLMFYNPVVLMEFRRIVQEEEKICDDVAASITGDRAALADTLRKFFYADEDNPASMKDAPRLRDRIEEYSHTILMESRISRLEGPPASDASAPAAFAVALIAILGINYFLV